MNYLVDPYAGEIVEFSKITTPAAMRASRWAPAAHEGALKAKSAAQRGGKFVRQTVKEHPGYYGFLGGVSAERVNQKINNRRRGGVGKAVTNPQFGTNVRRVSPLVPTGRHVSHENDLLDLKKRPRHKGPARGIERYSKRDQFEGGAVIAKRGTPMSNLAHSGRQGRRLVTV